MKKNTKKTDKGLFEHVHDSGFNPGSKNAQENGCKCPVLDNNHGAGFMWGLANPWCWYMNEHCPLHGNKTN